MKSLGARRLGKQIARTVIGAVSPRLLRGMELARRRAYFLREPTRGPQRILLEPTTACNHRCLMCMEHSALSSSPTRAAHMPFEILERLLRDMAALGVDEVWLAGRGEPLVHPRAVEMFELIGSLGMSSQLTTNGQRLHPELAARLSNSGLRQLSVSIDSGNAETYARLHQARAEDRARILGVIKSLSQRKPRPKLLASMVISKPNFPEILAFVRDAIGAGVDAVVIGGMRPVPFDTGELALADEDWARVRADLNTAGEMARLAGVELYPDAIRPAEKPAGQAPWPYQHMACFVGHTFAVIDVQGTVHGCCTCQNRLGSLSGASFPEIWRSRPYRLYRKTLREMPSTGLTPPMCDCRYGCGHIPENAAMQQELELKFGPKIGESEFATRLDLVRSLGTAFGEMLTPRAPTRSPGQTNVGAHGGAPTPAEFIDLDRADEQIKRDAGRLRELGVVKGIGSLDGRPVFDPLRMVARTELEEVLARALAVDRIAADKARAIIAESRVGSAAESEPLTKRELGEWVDGAAERARGIS